MSGRAAPNRVRHSRVPARWAITGCTFPWVAIRPETATGAQAAGGVRAFTHMHTRLRHGGPLRDRGAIRPPPDKLHPKKAEWDHLRS